MEFMVENYTKYFLYGSISGAHTYTLGNPTIAYIGFTDSLMILVGLSNNSVVSLGGSSIPSSANISFQSGVLTFTNPNSWNAQLFAIFP